MRRLAPAAAVLAAAVLHAAALSPVPAFSTLEPAGGVPPGWREVRLPSVKPPEYALVRDGGATVLQIRAQAAAGSIAQAADAAAAAAPRLSWRWKVDRVVDGGDLTRKSGDDFAARLYVFFDLPESELTFAARAKLRLARLLHGGEIPIGGLCYVWDNRQPPGTMRPNAYVPSVRMVVLESGAARAGTWIEESRDLVADFRAAFGYDASRPVPRVTGVALGSDTDQTGETATAWFGDIRLEARP